MNWRDRARATFAAAALAAAATAAQAAIATAAQAEDAPPLLAAILDAAEADIAAIEQALAALDERPDEVVVIDGGGRAVVVQPAALGDAVAATAALLYRAIADDPAMARLLADRIGRTVGAAAAERIRPGDPGLASALGLVFADVAGALAADPAAVAVTEAMLRERIAALAGARIAEAAMPVQRLQGELVLRQRAAALATAVIGDRAGTEP